ncbi:MAG: MGMT family protein, partial [Firmicutes bacterium]|nr:MGMT family protein [Bacillota bacterium]
MQIEEIIEFLETDRLSATFSPLGLKFLSLKADRGDRNIDLQHAGSEAEPDSEVKLILEETANLLKQGRHSMPLDLTDFTGFQQDVFKTVSEIEPGCITTYKGIAEIMGKPGAARAVGSAIAKNPVSYFLPTHRVLPQRGIGICRTGAGYLREKLLAHEGHDLSRLRGNY